MARPVVDPFRLRVADLKLEGWLDYQTHGLLVGSCFAEEIGKRLERDGFPVLVNPFGTAFNPLAALRFPFYSETEIRASIVERDGLFVSLLAHSDVGATSHNGLVDLFIQKQSETDRWLRQGGWFSLTLGTAWVYERKSDGLLCGNLHKQPISQFERRLLKVEEIVLAWEAFLKAYEAALTKRLLTVSPVIHGRDGLADNSLSKSVLRLAAHTIEKEDPGTTYFPSLEIVRDELRDYRFYAEDMQHPSAQAADIVYERFLSYALNPEATKVRSAFIAIRNFAEHRPRVVDAPLYREKLMELERLPISQVAKTRVSELLQSRMSL